MCPHYYRVRCNTEDSAEVQEAIKGGVETGIPTRWREKPSAFQTMRLCGHGYVDLPPSNDRLHDKYMRVLREYQRIVCEFKRHEEDSSYPLPKDADGKVVKDLPRKPQGKQPLLRCHCVQIQWSCNDQSNTCPVGYGGSPNCSICRCSC